MPYKRGLNGMHFHMILWAIWAMSRLIRIPFDPAWIGGILANSGSALSSSDS